MALHSCLLFRAGLAGDACVSCPEGIRFAAELVKRLGSRLNYEQVALLEQVGAVEGCEVLPGLVETYVGVVGDAFFDEILDALAASPTEPGRSMADEDVLAVVPGEATHTGQEWQLTAF